MREPPHSARVGSGELAALLALEGLRPVAASPLRDVAAAPITEGPDAAVLDALARTGWTEETSPPRVRAAGARALAVLAAPCRTLRMLVGSPTGVEVQEFYGGAGRDDWVRMRCDVQGTFRQLDFLLSVEDLLAPLEKALDLDATLLRPRFAARWPWPRCLGLLAALDVLRQRFLQSILARGPGPDLTFTADDLADAFTAGVSQPHYYWASSLGGLLAGSTSTAGRRELAAAAVEMEAAGAVLPAGTERYRPSTDLWELAVSLLMLPTFIVASSREAGSGPPARLAVLRGASVAWSLQFFEGDGGLEAAIEATDAGSLRSRLTALLAGERPHPAPEKDATGRPCPACGHHTRPGARFCGSCGHTFSAAPAASKARPVCPSCGRMLKVNARFCSGCGRSM